MQEKKREKIASLNRFFKRKKYFSILLALFTLGVNIFAWFAFSANVGLSLDATVASWDVEFRENNEVVSREIVAEVTKMKPGMDDYNMTIEVVSRSDVDADFSYKVLSFRLLGQLIDVPDGADGLNYIKTFYPFSISTSSSSNILPSLGTTNFEINVTWPYEAVGNPLYFGQDEAYSFDESFIYYTKSGSTYTKADITSTNYTSQRNNLYLEKDDADTYFGMKCKEYEASTGKACLELHMILLVEQKNS